MEYAICTFCFGERYYEQTNRMIKSFDYLSQKPDIYIVTDNTKIIENRDFVHVKNIEEYDPKYLSYEKNYYEFDFSVKRFSVKYAFESGYEKVILCDTDVVINPDSFSHKKIMECFVDNSIVGPVTYNFNQQIKANTYLGIRFLEYEEVFCIYFEKSDLDYMPEDCIQFISLNNDTKFKFIKTWDECINIKDEKKLLNSPCGNIDEMCFSALYNNISVGNNSNKFSNFLVAKHDKWY